tara:strand:- start:395 stop:562 length:168 start_codon:yes stop_codon:yes gene_type:complete
LSVDLAFTPPEPTPTNTPETEEEEEEEEEEVINDELSSILIFPTVSLNPADTLIL